MDLTSSRDVTAQCAGAVALPASQARTPSTRLSAFDAATAADEEMEKALAWDAAEQEAYEEAKEREEGECRGRTGPTS